MAVFILRLTGLHDVKLITVLYIMRKYYIFNHNCVFIVVIDVMRKWSWETTEMGWSSLK